MKSPYDQRTDKTRDRIRGNRKSYYPNKHYRSAEGNFYYYINTKLLCTLLKLLVILQKMLYNLI